MTNLFAKLGDYAGAAESFFYTAVVLSVLLGIVIRIASSRIGRARGVAVFRDPLAALSMGIILLYIGVAVLDSIVWPEFEDRGGTRTWVANPSLLDRIFVPEKEETLSAPLATKSFEGYRAKDLKGRHLLGTDLNGRDVLRNAFKGCRTALIIGGLVLIIVVPLGILFGVLAGYFGGRVDDLITYIFSVLESIPEILLLICLIKLFGQGLEQLCIALGITTWVGLCRVIRGETLKLRELPFVRAARALGVSSAGILWRHIVPNVMHIVLIASILRFSSIVLSEAILSYLGIGVGPEMGSWGAMIDQARNDLAREPVVWWNFTAAGSFLFVLILAANLFGDRLRDVLDPRLRGKGM